MQTIELPRLAERVRALPAEGVARRRHLYRLIDLHATDEANEALRSASTGGSDAILSGLLGAAVAVLEDLHPGHTARPDDLRAYERLRDAVTTPETLSLMVPGWVRELREIAASQPDTGACTLGSALELWLWTMKHFLAGEKARSESASQAVEELSEAFASLAATRCFVLEIAATNSPAGPEEAELRADLCHLHAGRVSASAGATCAELVFGYRHHLRWDAEGCATCYGAEELDDLEALVPGIASGARMFADVIEADGSHPAKAGPCVRFEGVDTFIRLRNRLDGCLSGARIARDRAAAKIERSIADTTPSNATDGRE